MGAILSLLSFMQLAAELRPHPRLEMSNRRTPDAGHWGLCSASGGFAPYSFRLSETDNRRTPYADTHPRTGVRRTTVIGFKLSETVLSYQNPSTGLKNSNWHIVPITVFLKKTE